MFLDAEAHGVQSDADGRGPAEHRRHAELRRNNAISASTDKAAAAQSTEPRMGSSIERGPASICITSRQTTWIANQMARFRITPTAAAVTAVVEQVDGAGYGLPPSAAGPARSEFAHRILMTFSMFGLRELGRPVLSVSDPLDGFAQ
jgi:hypothetical protein